ncbi:GIY-YIG nuclease family protein [Patescibacteria group bacterium]|nr:GIY-YIG nuclease family protein [Patescibacteria group bacterium]
MSSKYYYVYMISNFRRTVLYTGTTNNLITRVYAHRNELVKSFSQKYHLHDLLYYETFKDPDSAIAREKQIKSWSRKKKDQLIAS